MSTIGFIGLGNMGGGMAANILKAGFRLTVYDLKQEKYDIYRMTDQGSDINSYPWSFMQKMVL